ncbi:uncharacterized protein LOC121646426 [Melanotaenia boesemani]|uniref:uncharacterized protein LOC121646426 n=1 Tax=Melanotaenia boesemani TaxID=1250792 RepID=UPI001C04DBC0|nr:uncharacterized protein LOC121646426 [Melanotaenia boesemani]
MARAETIETTGESGGGGGNSPLPNAYCMLPCPLLAPSWPRLLSSTTSSISTGPHFGAMHLHHNNLDSLQALYLSYPLPYHHPEGQDQPQTHQQLPALSSSPVSPLSPLCTRGGEDRAGPSDLSAEQSGLKREEYQSPSSRQGALPDLLPRNEQPSRASPPAQLVQEMEIRRVANQLRMIGDEFNATVLRRAHLAPHWQDWRDVCRALLNFITQTLSTLYRLT